jgi:hypothetical protein
MKSAVTAARLQYTDDSTELVLTLKADKKTAQKCIQELREILAKGKLLQAEIKQYHKHRSLDANAYFHVLVGKLAQALNIGEDEAKVNLVLDYGSVMTDEEGGKVGFKLPASVNVNSIYKYAKWFDTRIENGKEFNCYIAYEHTRNYSTKQMARLIDGAVYECQNLGIETASPAELESLLKEWGNKNA